MALLIILILTMFTPVAIVAETQDVSKNNKPYGGTLVWGTCHKPTLINPILTTSSVSMSLLELIFNSLVRINSKGEIEPDLAKTWDISSDGLIYTFHLRQGVKFHDGVKCTAQDVEFTFDKILDQKVNSPFKSSLKLIKEFKALDKYTFQITLKKSSVSFLYRLTREIVPKHLLEEVNLETCFFNFKPIGTGPFRFKEWTGKNQIILEYNSDYYEDRPYLDEIIVKTYPDSRGMWSAFMRGEADFVLFIEREDYEVAKDDSSFNAYVVPADYYFALDYKFEDSVLADKRVRKAIAYAIDKQNLIETTGFGYGLECNGPFYPGSLGFDPYTQVFEYTPDKARQLLAEAGWEDKNSKGILENQGRELELRVLVDSRKEAFKRIILTLRQQFQEIGIKIKVILYEDESVLVEEFLKKNKIQVHLRLLLAGIDPDQAREYWFSKKCKRVNKLWVYSNDDVDRLFRAGEVTLDKGRRGGIYRKIHQLIYEQQPVCFLYFPFVFHALSNKFENVTKFFNVSMPFYMMKDWYVKSSNE